MSWRLLLRRGVHALRPPAGEEELNIALEAGDLRLNRPFEGGCRWGADREDIANTASRRRDEERIEANAGAIWRRRIDAADPRNGEAAGNGVPRMPRVMRAAFGEEREEVRRTVARRAVALGDLEELGEGGGRRRIEIARHEGLRIE